MRSVQPWFGRSDIREEDARGEPTVGRGRWLDNQPRFVPTTLKGQDRSGVGEVSGPGRERTGIKELSWSDRIETREAGAIRVTKIESI
jgi:hypothetical protein